MNGSLFLLWFVIIFFGVMAIGGGLIIYFVWQRRKLIVTHFLSKNGQWSKKFWKPADIGETFTYNDCTYKFDVEKCTRDHLNRPVAHYYSGNPEQQEFNYSLTDKRIIIGTKDISARDFIRLMLSKVLKDIFSDDEMMMLLYIIMVEVAVVGIACIIITLTHNPEVVLKADNQTIAIISAGVRQALGGV